MTPPSAPSLQDPVAWLLDDRGQGLLRMTLVFTIVLALALTVLAALLSGNPAFLWQTPLFFCELGYSALGLYYLRRDPQRAVTVVLWGLLLSVLIQCTWATGVHSAAAVVLPTLLVVGCFVLPRRQVIVMAALSLVWLCVLAALHQHLYATLVTRSTSTGFLMAYLFAIPLSTSAALLIGRALLGQVERTRQANAALAAKLAELQQSNDMFARLFQLVPVPLAIATLSEGRHLTVNDAWLQTFRLQRDQVVGLTGIEIGLWPDLVTRQAWADAIAAGHGAVVSSMVRLRDAEGSLHDMMISALTIQHAGQECLLSANIDLTERLRAEAEVTRLNARLAQQVNELQRSQLKFSTLFTLNPVAISVTLLEDGSYYDVNPAWEKATGYTRSEVLGRTSGDLGIWMTDSERQHWIAALSNQSHLPNYQARFRMRSGEVRSYLIDAQLVEYDNQSCVISAFVDITDRLRIEAELRELNARMEVHVQERSQRLSETVATLQRAQEELVHAEKLASLGSLVAGVAHELNTPIGNAVLITSTLNDKLRSLRAEVRADRLRRSTLDEFLADAGQAGSLLENSLWRARELIRSFKQVAIDQTSERRRPCGLNELVRDVCDTLRPSLRNPHWRLELELGEEIALDSYPGPLGQVLTNLIQNAFFHGLSEDQPGCVRVTVCPLAGEQVEISVRDDGRGIAPEHIGHIFDPFFTTRLGHGGSGLGLNIVYGIVTKLLGGRIQVASDPGQGTCFTLSLPRRAPDTP